jgi:glycosyltransferase involved in cell wall biosynthesis
VKVAYYSPLPPDRSGIADYSALLVPALRKRIRLGIARRIRRPHLRCADVDLYHVGNNPESHAWIVRALRRRPGVIVLHEFVLHHLVAGMTLGRGDLRAYVEAMRKEAGAEGVMLAWGVIEGVVPALWEAQPERFPLALGVLEHATGVIVHSRFVEERVRENGFTGPVWRVPHPAWPVSSEGPAERVAEGPVIGCFGHLNPSKRLAELLAAFAEVRRTTPSAVLVLAGSVSPRIGLEDRLRRLGLESGRDVIVLDYVSEERLWALIRGCDVCVNLRSPTMGETSGMVIRILSAGKPVVVSDVGWFSELPGAVAVKVPVDDWEVETLAATLRLLADDADMRRGMSLAAREYALGEHSVERTADLYVAALEETAGRDAVEAKVLRDVAQAAGEVGLEPEGPEVRRLADRLREVGFGG